MRFLLNGNHCGRITGLCALLFVGTTGTSWILPEARADDSRESRALVRSAFNGDCEKTLMAEIGGAEKEVLVAIYSLTRHNIVSALLSAVERGVMVTVKYDAKSADELEEMRSLITQMKKQKIRCYPVTVEDAKGRMHNKFTVIDRRKVITGSYNYTTSATRVNDENLVVIESPETAKAFAEEFERIKSR